MEFISDYIAFSSPSGGGKTTIVKQLAAKYNNLVISVSATTRARRPGEVEGRDYYFLTESEFKAAVEADRFLEFELVHGSYYGTLKDTVDQAVKKGNSVLFDIDVKGAQAIKKHYPQAVTFFIKPPNKEELVRRLKNRRSEDQEAITQRLKRMEFEYSQAERFDYIVVNDRLQDTIREIEEIIVKNND